MDTKVSAAHVVKIAKFLPKWKVVARLLGLESEMVKDIEHRYRDGEDQRIEALMKWVGKEGSQATYGKLYGVLLEMEEGEAAEKVMELMRVRSTAPASPQDSSDGHPPPYDAPPLVQRTTLIPSSDPALEKSIMQLEEHFQVVVLAIQEDCKCFDIGDLKTYVTLIPTKIKKEHTPFLKENMQPIAHATCIVEIFTILNVYWDFLNYGLLEHLVERCGCNQTKHLMEQFVRDLKAFMEETRVADFIRIWRGKEIIPPEFHQLIVRHGLNPDHTTLHVLNDFRKDFCQHYSLHQVVLMFNTACCGSLVVVWLIPFHVAEHLYAEFNTSAFCYEVHIRYSILEVTINEVGTSGKDDELHEDAPHEDAVCALLKTSPSISRAPLTTGKALPRPSQALSEEHCTELLKATSKAADRWRAIGRELGFRTEELDAIVKESGCHNDEDLYKAMVMSWLEWAPPSHHHPTLKSLVAAIRAVGNEKVANNVAQALTSPEIPPGFILDAECSTDTDAMLRIARLSFDWRRVGKLLIGNHRVTDIECEEHDEEKRKEKMLLTWLQLHGSRATYRHFEEVLKGMEINTTTEEVTKLVREGAGNRDTRRNILPKEFYWDRIATIIVAGILGLTFIEFVAEVFYQPSSTVMCNTPATFTRDQAAFVNSFCFSSLPSAQYYTLFIMVHSLLLIAPHQLWTWLFSGYVEYFFDLAKSLDRLKNSKTGEYDSKNTAIVSKLEIEFLTKNRWIFSFYKVKLCLQLVIAVISLTISWTIFEDFRVVFQCPQNGSQLCTNYQCSFEDSWPSSIDCAYIPLQLLSVLRYVDVSLVSLLIPVLLYGVAWCYQGHPTELGAEKMALFAFTSCLLPDTYVFPSAWASLKRRGLKGLGRGLFSPGIKNDLDFLLGMLFHADSHYGQVFKEIQVAKECRRLHTRDHELLHLFVNLQQDVRTKKERKLRHRTTNEIEVVTQETLDEESIVSRPLQKDHTLRNSTCVPCCKRKRKDSDSDDTSDDCSTDEDLFLGVNDEGKVSARKRKKEWMGHLKETTSDCQQAELKTYFKNAGFDGNPEKVAYLSYKPDLGNTHWTDIETIRNRFYGFVQFAPNNDVAVDISFGSVGFTLALARAFRTAMSVNFNEFYKEDEPKKQSFYTNYHTFMFPQDVFSRSNLVLNKTNQCFYEEFEGREHKISFIVVGPIDDQSKITTVNLLINTFYTTNLIEEEAILLAVRPLQIEHEVTADKYFSYKPSKSLFDSTFHYDIVEPQLKEEYGKNEKETKSREGLYQTVTVGKRKHRGLRICCADTECVFEFKAYKFNPNDECSSGKRKHEVSRTTAQKDGEEKKDKKVLVQSEKDGVASLHNSYKYGNHLETAL